MAMVIKFLSMHNLVMSCSMGIDLITAMALTKVSNKNMTISTYLQLKHMIQPLKHMQSIIKITQEKQLYCTLQRQNMLKSIHNMAEIQDTIPIICHKSIMDLIMSDPITSQQIDGIDANPHNKKLNRTPTALKKWGYQQWLSKTLTYKLYSDISLFSLTGAASQTL